MKELIIALEETNSLLQSSQSSVYANLSVEELIEELESEITKAKNSKSIDARRLMFLFGPTGPIQDTAIDNGWGAEFLRISNVVDQFNIDK